MKKYYQPDVVIQENELQPMISKDANRRRELEFLKNITEFRKAEVKGSGDRGWNPVRYLELRLHAQAMGRKELFTGIDTELEGWANY